MKSVDWKQKLLTQLDLPITEMDDITLMATTNEEILTERERLKEDNKRLRGSRDNLINQIESLTIGDSCK